MIEKQAKPFLKWAGGKTQLLTVIGSEFHYKHHDKFVYVEPFVGSGAVLFWVLSNYPNVEKVIINDINFDLINSYKIIKNNVATLINILEQWQKEYYAFVERQDLKKKYYYAKRELFNKRIFSDIEQAA
ncbi:MAG: DNA adenine methylase, partial [Cyanobacteria bacterium P01_F01_bin.143]